MGPSGPVFNTETKLHEKWPPKGPSGYVLRRNHHLIQVMIHLIQAR